MTTPPYELDKTRINRNNRKLEMLSLADISPETALMRQVQVQVYGRSEKSGFDVPVLPTSWRRRLAEVTQT